jgi:hypothetical protein
MKKEYKANIITRRDFLRGTAYGSLSLVLGLQGTKTLSWADETPTQYTRSNQLGKVVLVRSDAAVGKNHSINPEAVAKMIDTAVKTLANNDDIIEAWQNYIRPADKVGVKFSDCSWMRVPTERAVVDAIVKRISDIGVSKRRIYPKDYHLPFKKCTALINVPSVKIHSLTGLAAALKNYINFTKKESSYHFHGSVKLGGIWNLPKIKGKTRLVIVDALRPYFGPGPQINPLYRWDYKGILVGTDPVAVDTVCLAICQAKRNLFRGEKWPITPPPKHIVAADTTYKLGTSDPSKIGLIKKGWERDILI